MLPRNEKNIVQKDFVKAGPWGLDVLKADKAKIGLLLYCVIRVAIFARVPTTPAVA